MDVKAGRLSCNNTKADKIQNTKQTRGQKAEVQTLTNSNIKGKGK